MYIILMTGYLIGTGLYLGCVQPAVGFHTHLQGNPFPTSSSPIPGLYIIFALDWFAWNVSFVKGSIFPDKEAANFECRDPSFPNSISSLLLSPSLPCKEKERQQKLIQPWYKVKSKGWGADCDRISPDVHTFFLVMND
jgi:hypothetical protein